MRRSHRLLGKGSDLAGQLRTGPVHQGIQSYADSENTITRCVEVDRAAPRLAIPCLGSVSLSG
jgi:hypothetical protein